MFATAAKVGCEPRVPDAARYTNGGFLKFAKPSGTNSYEGLVPKREVKKSKKLLSLGVIVLVGV
jgi:hypothetical protein